MHANGNNVIKLSDYVIQFIVALGVKHIFMLPGGGAMHLNDSIRKCKEIQFVCNLHEEACAIAAEAYARVTNNLGVAVVTTGPGGTNTITGVAAAWLDSTPCYFISGQVKRADMKLDTGVRQLGVQEIDIVTIVKSITKYAVTVMDPEDIRFHLEKAAYLAKTGRPGPVWLDIPLDVQAAMIDPTNLKGFDPEELNTSDNSHKLVQQVQKVLDLINSSERPLILVGNGVRLANAKSELLKMIDLLGIPVETTWLGLDLVSDEHPLLIGRPGSIAPRGANFAIQNSDLLLIIGTRLDNATTGYAHDKFARAAKKIMIDVDPNEIKKMKMKIELPIIANAKDFINEMIQQSQTIQNPSKVRRSWVKRCQEWKNKYPVVLPEFHDIQQYVSGYVFSEVMSEEMDYDDVIVPMSSGSSIEIFFLALKAKEGQRIFHNRGTGSMGLALPASIGAYFAINKRIICIEGDGGIQQNIQEFETVIHLNLPIKIFVLNNQGYASIRTSQLRYFGGLIGADRNSGLSLPNIVKVAESYGFATDRIENHMHLRHKIKAALNSDGPFLCEVMLPPDEVRAPSISSRQLPDGSMISTPLEDLWPFLDRDEFLSNMLIPPIN